MTIGRGSEHALAVRSVTRARMFAIIVLTMGLHADHARRGLNVTTITATQTVRWVSKAGISLDAGRELPVWGIRIVT
jgi:hypothetical protein